MVSIRIIRVDMNDAECSTDVVGTHPPRLQDTGGGGWHTAAATLSCFRIKHQAFHRLVWGRVWVMRFSYSKASRMRSCLDGFGTVALVAGFFDK